MMQYSPGKHGSPGGDTFVFGEFELNPDRAMLLKNGVELPLRRQCFQVLHYLIRHQGVLVSKQELMDAVWSEVIVTESSLTQCILTIRRVLDDDSKTIIRSIPRSGYLFDHPVTVKKRPPPETVFILPPQAKWRTLVPWGTAAFFLLALAVFLYARNTDPHASSKAQQMADVAPLPTSIAVLPFGDLSPSQDQEQFAYAISEDVLNVLARNPNLVVIASASAFSFKGMNKDIKVVAARLNVANVLEGSVRRDDNRLRVVTRLVNAKGNRSIWSHTYDLDANDVHSLHNTIANAVVSVLGVEQAENIPVAASKPEALRRYLMGKHFYGRRAPGDLERAIDQFRSAVEIDPGLTNGWVGLAGSLWSNSGQQTSRLPAIREEMKYALDRALELDPNNPEANARIAQYYWIVDLDHLAVRHFERAVELSQNNPQVLAIAALYAFGHFNYQQAVEIQQRVTVLDPLSFVQQVNLALFLRYAGRLDDSIAAYKIAFDLNPEAAIAFREDYVAIFLLNGKYDQAETLALQLPEGPARDHQLAMVYLALDQPSRSGEMIRQLSTDTSSDTALRLAEYYAYAGDIDLSFHWLDEARKRQGGVDLNPVANTYFEVFLHSPFLQELKQDVRWQAWQTYLVSQLQTPAISINTKQLVITDR